MLIYIDWFDINISNLSFNDVPVPGKKTSSFLFQISVTWMHYTKAPAALAQPYIGGWMGCPSKNSVLFGFELTGNMKTAIFHADIWNMFPGLF